MTITQLGTFLKITELNSFSAAAISLGYAQSTVTTQIKQLEDELGCVLFDRLGKMISVAPAGERLIVYAEKMLQLEREIHLDVTDEGSPAGVLKLGVSESLCVSRFPLNLMEFNRNNPRTEIRIQFVTHENIPDLLQKGELDMVYTLNPLIKDSVFCKCVFCDKVCTCLSTSLISYISRTERSITLTLLKRIFSPFIKAWSHRRSRNMLTPMVLMIIRAFFSCAVCQKKLSVLNSEAAIRVLTIRRS